MKGDKRGKDSVVKIDSELAERIEEFIKKNKFSYSSKKQVVDLAIIEFLNLKLLDNKDKKKVGEKR